MCRSRLILLVALATLVTPLAAGAAAGATRSLVLVSRATGEHGRKTDAQSFSPRISGDGRHVGFSTWAGNLDPADTDGFMNMDVYARELDSRTTTLVSRADGAAGAKGDADSVMGGISTDGRYVLFGSLAANLDAADTDAQIDLYVRDLLSGDTILVDRADGDGEKANAESLRTRLSADGRYVAFTSKATNLDAADTEADSDVFVRDLVTKETTLATPGIDGPVLAALSADGRRIAYIVGDAGARDPTQRGLLYVRDLVTGEVTFPGLADGPSGNRANGYTIRAGVSLSADGRYVAFSSRATNLDPADGDRRADLYVRDLQANETTLASRADGRDGAKGNADSPSGGALSADGRYVAWTSFAWNLDPLDDRNDNESDVFVRDLRRGETTLADVSVTGRKGDLGSSEPSLSADGRYVAFLSSAENLDPAARDITDDIESEPLDDVFVRDLRAPVAAPGRRPRSRINAVRRRRSVYGESVYVVTGGARDDHALLNVDLSLTRRIRTPSGVRCQAAKDTAEEQFWVLTASARRRCRPRFFWHATSTRDWRVSLPGEIAEGTYTLTSRATDTAGQRERGFSRRRGNVRTFRVSR